MLPGVDDLLHAVLSGEVKKFTRQVKGQGQGHLGDRPPLIRLPKNGLYYMSVTFVQLYSQPRLIQPSLLYVSFIQESHMKNL